MITTSLYVGGVIFWVIVLFVLSFLTYWFAVDFLDYFLQYTLDRPDLAYRMTLWLKYKKGELSEDVLDITEKLTDLEDVDIQSTIDWYRKEL